MGEGGVVVVLAGPWGSCFQNVGPICIMFVLFGFGREEKRSLNKYTVAECGLISSCLIPYLLTYSLPRLK